MGRIWDLDDYGDNCLSCFPPGETPKYFFATLSGVKPGDLYDPDLHPPPPNYGWKLTQNAGIACIWDGMGGGWTVQLSMNAALSFFIVMPLPFIVEWAGQSNSCATGFSASAVTPVGERYYGGGVGCVPVPATVFASAEEIANALNIPTDDPIKWQAWYAGLHKKNFRYASREENTNILIAYEWPDIPLGGIVLWSGAIVDIPPRFNLCDGTSGTPDLRNRFIVGAGDTYAVGANGGSTNRNHVFQTDVHFHNGMFGRDFGTPPIPFGFPVDLRFDTGTTDLTNSLPTYYSLAYVMRIV